MNRLVEVEVNRLVGVDSFAVEADNLAIEVDSLVVEADNLAIEANSLLVGDSLEADSPVGANCCCCSLLVGRMMLFVCCGRYNMAFRYYRKQVQYVEGVAVDNRLNEMGHILDYWLGVHGLGSNHTHWKNCLENTLDLEVVLDDFLHD